MRDLDRRTFGKMLAAAPAAALATPARPGLTLPGEPAWAGWGQVRGMLTISAPGAGSYGLLAVRGPDSGIYYNFIGDSPTSWGGWRQIPGAGRTPSGPCVVDWDDLDDGNRLAVFVRDENSGIQFNFYVPEDRVWRGWQAIPGRGLTPSAPAAEWLDGRLYVFVRDENDGIQFNRLENFRDHSSWSGWRAVPGAGLTPSAPAAAFGNGRSSLSVVVRGLDNGIYENIASGDGEPTWSGWHELPGGGRTPSGPAAIETYSGQPPVIVQGLDGGVYYELRDPIVRRRPGPVWKEIPGGQRTSSAPGVALFDYFVHPLRFVFVRGLDNLIYYNYYQL